MLKDDARELPFPFMSDAGMNERKNVQKIKQQWFAFSQAKNTQNKYVFSAFSTYDWQH